MQTTQTELEPGQAVWEAVLERGCGLDVHQKMVTALTSHRPTGEAAEGISTHFSNYHERASGAGYMRQPLAFRSLVLAEDEHGVVPTKAE